MLRLNDIGRFDASAHYQPQTAQFGHINLARYCRIVRAIHRASNLQGLLTGRSRAPTDRGTIQPLPTGIGARLRERAVIDNIAALNGGNRRK